MSNRSLELLQNEPKTGTLLLLPDGTVQFCDAIAAALLGCSIEQLIGETISQFSWYTEGRNLLSTSENLTPEDHPASVALRTGQPCQNKLLGLARSDGNLIWLWVSSTPLFQTAASGSPAFGSSASVPPAIVTTLTQAPPPQTIATSAGQVAGQSIGQSTGQSIGQFSETQLAQALAQTHSCLQTIVESTEDIIFIKDLQGRYLLANTVAANWLGTTVEAMLGQDDRALFSPEIAESIMQSDRQVIQTGESIAYIEEVPRQNKIRWLQSSKYPWRDQGGTAIGVIGICRDVSDAKLRDLERMRVEEERQQAQQFREQVAAAAPGMLYVYDLIEQRNVYINRQVGTVLGYTPAQIEQMGDRLLQLLMHPEDFARLPYHHQRIHQSGEGEVVELEYRMRRVNGEWCWLLAREVVFSRTAEGIPQQILGISQDITDRKRTQIALEEAYERMSIAQRCAQAGLWDWNLVRQDVFWSPEYYAVYGLNPSQTPSYENWLASVVEEDRDRTHREVQEAIAQHKPIYSEFRYRHPEKGIRWFASIGNVIYSENGQPQRAIGISLDITDAKQKEEERRRSQVMLRESEQRLQAIIDNSKAAIFVKDVKGYYLLMNRECARLFHITDDWIRGKTDYDIFTKEIADRVRANDQKVIETGTAITLEEEVELDDGVHTYIAVKFPLFDEAGTLYAVCGISTDISDRVRFQAERDRILQQEQAARAEADRANRVKDEFLAVLSHELRSPLNPILGWTKLLQNRQFDPDRAKEALAVIERNAKLQAQLIDDLLDVSRIINGKLSLNAQPVDFPFIVSAALETVRLNAEAKQIQIETVLEPGTAPLIGDAARLQQVVWNLLSNAIKFTPSGGQILIHLEEEIFNGAPHAKLTVTDSGKGIKPEFLPYLFEYFRQEDATTTRRFGGLGLGLAIVRQIVELHRGTVSAESPGEGQGATFMIRLPLQAEADEAVQENIFPDRATPESDALPLAGIQVLVVDDDRDTLAFYQVALEAFGAAVTVANSAAEALQRLSQASPDVLLSDIGMPDTNGYELMQQVREIEAAQGKQIPAIAITAYASDADRELAFAAGFQAHLPKPIDPATLVTAIVQCVSEPIAKPFLS